jgi:hypothetical protein
MPGDRHQFIIEFYIKDFTYQIKCDIRSHHSLEYREFEGQGFGILPD